MLLLEGIPISPGYASGTSVVYDYEIERRLELPHRAISNSEVETEWKRVDDALEQSGQDIKRVGQTALKQPRFSDAAALVSAHSAMAKEIAALVKQHVGREFVNVEQALDAVIRDWVERFGQLDNAYLREREQDVRDVGRRMTHHLAGSLPLSKEPLPYGSVIVARELLPSETVELANSGVVAIVSEHGGKYSHTAIVARSLGIPAITGIPNVTLQIHPGMRLLVDGEAGSVVIAPSQSDEGSFAKRKREYESLATSIAVKENLPCVTQDGIEISLLANVGGPNGVMRVAEHNLAGAGLFRTEFLFLESHERPSFQVQSEMYDSMARDLAGLPLVIRTFDLGGDKLPPFLLLEESETHTSLHLRGLRFSLAERHLLDTQLRAILHVAQTADVRILFPMVVGSDDFARAIAAADAAADQLGVLRKPPVGAMIETPAALYALDEILELADFVAIGTNDLTQYMLATDRGLAEGVDDCTAMHPAVLRAIKQVVEAAERHDCPVCVCGEEAGDVDFACLLVGLGVRELSLSPARAAGVRHALRHIGCDDASKVADLALKCRTPQQVQKLLEKMRKGEAGSMRWDAAEPNQSVSKRLMTGKASSSKRVSIANQRTSLPDMNGASSHRLDQESTPALGAEQGLTAAEQDARLAAVAFNTHDSIVITDKIGKILRVNKSFTELTGYTPEDVIGKTPRVLRSGRHNKEFYREMWRAIGTKGGWEGEIWNKRKDGHVYLQRLTIACVKNESGETTNYVGDGQDLTLPKQGEIDRAAISAAHAVQSKLFPSSAPCVSGFDIAGTVHPAERVSGDFFDYLPLGQNSVGLLVADVSGHGLGPAMLMAQTQAYLHALAESHSDPGELLTRASRLFATSDCGHFVTTFLGRIDVATRSLVYAGAGHQGYLISSHGEVQVLDSTGIPLGVDKNTAIRSAPEIILKPGDTLVVPTDGTEEALSPGGRMFGRERMLDVVRENREESAAQIVDALFCATRDFTEDQPQQDDITALVVKVLPSASAGTSAQPDGCG